MYKHSMEKEIKRYEDKDLHNLVTLQKAHTLGREARKVYDTKKKKEYVQIENEEGEQLVVDPTVLAIWHGIERGASAELVQAGLGDFVQEIYGEEDERGK